MVFSAGNIGIAFAPWERRADQDLMAAALIARPNPELTVDV